jgi:galactonate dehydratase
MHAGILHRRARLERRLAPQVAAAGAKPSPLDIVEIRHFPVREPVSGNRYTVLRVKTRSGLTGWGECGFDPASDPQALQSAWVGKPAHTYAAITLSTPFAAALDMALLDVLGKACKAPVCRVLGCPTRNRVRAFSTPDEGEFPVSLIAVPAPLARNQGKAYQNQVRALVDRVPSDRDFVLAGNGRLTPGDAATVASSVETRHPLWFDEPCAHTNLEAVRKISAETVVPLGFGRGIRDAGTFQALLRDGLIDVVRPELAFFGITGVKRIAALAETYYVAVAPHHDGGPLATAAAIHLAASIPNFFIQHLPIPKATEDRAMRREIVTSLDGNGQDLEAGRGGFLDLPKAPGLGVTVNESALEKYRVS